MALLRIFEFSGNWRPKARLIDTRVQKLHLAPRKRQQPIERDFSAVLIRVAFALLLCALLYSTAISFAAAAETNTAEAAQPRTLQTLASIRSAAEQYVRDISQINAAHSGTLLATAAELDVRLQLDQCSEALTAFTLNAAPISARVTIGVRCEHGATWTVYVPVNTESEIDALVLRNSMPRDAHLAAGDLETQHRRVPGLTTAYITTVATLRDQHLKRTTPAGTILLADMMMRDLVVKRGQQVLLVFDANGLVIQAPGLALADGGTTDRIRVQNQTSLKVVEGVIESGNLVRVGL